MTKKIENNNKIMKTVTAKKFNYRIFRVENSDDCDVKKITIVRIYAENDNDAYVKLKEFRKTANSQYKYYVEKWTPSVLIRNGKKIIGDDFNEILKKIDEDKSFIEKILEKTYLELRWWFTTVPKNVYHRLRDMIYLIKTKHQYRESWSIDETLLDVLMFNLPILKKTKHTLSWAMLEKAWLEKHKDKTEKDAKNYFNSRQSWSEDISNRSIELEHKLFDDLVNDINAYRYYCGEYMYIDKNDRLMVEVDNNLRKTLPLIKGSYDSYDMKKIDEMVDKHWNRIWDTVRKYGREFND